MCSWLFGVFVGGVSIEANVAIFDWNSPNNTILFSAHITYPYQVLWVLTLTSP